MTFQESFETRANKRIKELESKIDWLMFEYCPDEMTPERLKRFEESQVKTGIDNV